MSSRKPKGRCAYAERIFMGHDRVQAKVLSRYARQWHYKIYGRAHLPTGAELPKAENINDYILSALREKDLKYFSFFLHHYEPQLNNRIKSFLGVDSGDQYDPERFLDIKLSCREAMLQKPAGLCP